VIVADASVVIESLINSRPKGRAIRRRLASEKLRCPHLMDIEVAAALRLLVARGRLNPEQAHFAIVELSQMRVDRRSHTDYLERVWELRDSVSAYDAVYVAIAEHGATSLLTLDRRLASAHGPRCAIEVL